MSEGAGAARLKLNALLTETGQRQLDSEVGRRFEDYLLLILRWNARVSLTAIRDERSPSKDRLVMNPQGSYKKRSASV